MDFLEIILKRVFTDYINGKKAMERRAAPVRGNPGTEDVVEGLVTIEENKHHHRTLAQQPGQGRGFVNTSILQQDVPTRTVGFDTSSKTDQQENRQTMVSVSTCETKESVTLATHVGSVIKEKV